MRHELRCFSDQITADHSFWWDSVSSSAFSGGACAQSLLGLLRELPGASELCPESLPCLQPAAHCCSGLSAQKHFSPLPQSLPLSTPETFPYHFILCLVKCLITERTSHPAVQKSSSSAAQKDLCKKGAQLPVWKRGHFQRLFPLPGPVLLCASSAGSTWAQECLTGVFVWPRQLWAIR